MIVSCAWISRFASLMDMLGKVTGMYSSEPSSRGGMNSEPRFMNRGTAMARARMFRAMVVFFQTSAQRMTGEYNFMKKAETGLELSGGILPRMK